MILKEAFIQTSFLSMVKWANTFWATTGSFEFVVVGVGDVELSIGVRSLERPSSARRLARKGLSSARDAILRLTFQLNEGRTIIALAVFLAITSRCICR